MRFHSSRRTQLAKSVLNDRLLGAASYDRIAGYFRSSLFEVASEALDAIAGPVRIICNSELNPEDIKTAAAAQAAIRKSWCAGKPEDTPVAALPIALQRIGLEQDRNTCLARLGAWAYPRQGRRDTSARRQCDRIPRQR